MSESTKVMKKRKRESTIIHGRPQIFFQGGNVDISFIIFKLLTISVPLHTWLLGLLWDFANRML